MKFLDYNLARFLLALFNECGTRKTTKYFLYTMFEPTNKVVQLFQINIIVDRGFLLQRVIWQRDGTVVIIYNGFITTTLE